MSMQKINCSQCMIGKHQYCLDPSNCLCADDNHGIKEITLRDAGKPPSGPVEPKIYDQALHDALQLEDYLDNGPGNNSVGYAVVELAKLLVISKHMISKIELERELSRWNNKYHGEIDASSMAIAMVWGDIEFFEHIKSIAFAVGKSGKKINFDDSQLIEAAWYLRGRYHIKRIELTGDLLFWNDRYYENNADALIRRKARDIVFKAQTKDINEIVKIIEDSCKIITWKDIESSVHFKCFLNGIYDIKNGVFSKKFNPDYIIVSQIPHMFDESEKFDGIDQKVSEIITDKNNKQSFYDFLSICLMPYTGIDFQFGGVGRAGTGKSQLCDLAQMVLGEENVSNSPIHQIASDQTTQKACAYKILNIDNDLSSESIKQIDVLKKWITQDKFTARGIYSQPTTFKPMSRLMFMANDLYEISNTDDAEAIYERTHIIRIDNKFRGQDNEIKRVFLKIATKKELSGLVTYLCKNSTELYNNQAIHHPMPYSIVEETWNTFGNRIKEFVKKWIVLGVPNRTEASEPWDKWLGFALKKGYQAKDKKKFREIFDELVGSTATKTRIDDMSVYAYTGFRIKTDEEVAKEETLNFDDSEKALKALIFYSLSSTFKIIKNYKKNIKHVELLELDSPKDEEI